jgi:hypothetical protein
MDIKFRVVSGLVLLAILNFSCSSTINLHKGFTRKQASLKYIHDTEQKSVTPVDTVVILKPVITDRKFTSVSSVEKTRAYFVPAIVYNEWYASYQYWIGSSVVEESIPAFIRSSVVHESKRNGSFVADTTLLSTDKLMLEISVDTIGAGGSYEDRGFWFFAVFVYGYSEEENAGPGIAYSNFHYRLKQGDVILLEGDATDSRETEALVFTQKSPKELRTYYTTNLVEALSLTFKTNIETIIKRINTFLDDR